MKHNIEEIRVVSREKKFFLIQGWALSEECTKEKIRILTGECYKIVRVDREDVALAFGRGKEDCKYGFEIIIEYPHNGMNYTIEISDGVECIQEDIIFADFCTEQICDSNEALDLYTERLSTIEYFESEGINYNVELIAWKSDIHEFVLRGWEFSKASGKSELSLQSEGRCIRCTRKDVRSYFKQRKVQVDESCGFEIYVDDHVSALDIVFEGEQEKVELHLGADYLKKISSFSVEAVTESNSIFSAIKKHNENKNKLERYGEEGLKYKKNEREINLEEESFNRATYSYEKIDIPLSWIHMQRKQPTVDIIIAVRDVETRMIYIQEMIESLAKQKYRNFRVIFAGEEKDIRQIVINGELDSISIISNNSDKLQMYYDALENSEAEYFIFVNQEDYVEDDFLASYIEQINLNPDKAVFYANFDISWNGELIFPIIRKEKYNQENLEFRLIATMFSKEMTNESGGFQEVCNKACDNVVGISRVYYHYRMVSDAFSNSVHSKAIAFYLPQFHENNENNKWWGKGFTEWTNVRRAVPMFEGHNQPRVPADLGYYDLVEDKSIQYKQVELAMKYGVYGFCFYYYWFAGKRLLRKPFDQFVEDKNIKFPFCICWANETWSRRWNGDEHEILMKQVHNAKTDKRFIYSVMPLFKDERYIRIDGKPLLLIYRIELFPKPAQTIRKWRELCRKEGIGDIHVALVQSFGMVDHRIYGADSSVEFPPHKIQASEINSTVLKDGDEREGKIYSYEEVVKNQMIVQKRDYTLFPGSMLGWDNTARRMKAANVFHGYTPELFEQWLIKNYIYTRIYNTEPVMFINAWNEWAEGTYLEPDQKFGTRALEVVNEVVNFM